MDILRFITAGSVDDGKSTLIGRLLFDTHNIKTDVLQSVSAHNGPEVNLAHITDGLRSERTQGITIDVAYKYITSPKRKYIITDAPGHAQYTKNLVTGASGADAMIILIDAQNGITEQTRRHSLVASFLKMKQVVVAINKMDIMGYNEQVFAAIKKEYAGIAHKLQLRNITFIPISALYGDNVSRSSDSMNWYKGKTLMQYLESCEPMGAHTDDARFSVQCVIDSDKTGLEKGFAGKMLSGSLKVGDVVSVYGNVEKTATVVEKIIHGYSEVQEAVAGDNVSLYLMNDTGVGRGALITPYASVPNYTDQLEATICWLDTKCPLQTDKEYLLTIGTTETVCTIAAVMNKIDVTSFEKYNDAQLLEVNGFAEVRIKTGRKIPCDVYADIPENGRGIIIDTRTNYTSGAFVINQ